MTLGEVLARARDALRALPQASPRLEAELLLAEVIDKPRSYLFAWPERELSPESHECFTAFLQRRLAGEPMAYILGQREFWSLNLRITPDVLIPRPETELLVQLALELFPAGRAVDVADLGTGSGALAAALAHERPNWHLSATDASPAALELAQENFHRLGLHNVRTLAGSWCQALPGGSKLDLILSNPPYVAAGDPHLGQGDLPHEPIDALASGEDGLDAIRAIARHSPGHLVDGGWLLLEHGQDQGGAVRGILADAGFSALATHRDLAQRDRATLGRIGG